MIKRRTPSHRSVRRSICLGAIALHPGHPGHARSFYQKALELNQPMPTRGLVFVRRCSSAGLPRTAYSARRCRIGRPGATDCAAETIAWASMPAARYKSPIVPVWPNWVTPSARVRWPCTDPSHPSVAGCPSSTVTSPQWRGTHASSRSTWLGVPGRPSSRARCARVQPPCSRSAEVTASRPMSRRSSPISPAASIASGATAPVYAMTASALGPGRFSQ